MIERAEQLQQIRAELGLSGRDFASLLQVSFRTLKKWEDGEKEVPRTALKFAEMILDAELIYKEEQSRPRSSP